MPDVPAPNGNAGMGEVFRIFLRLGLTSFGGPIAHLGYFRREFVERLAWMDETAFAGIIAFCSVLPGPTSSQTGMLIGLTRAGAGGAFAAWLRVYRPVGDRDDAVRPRAALVGGERRDNAQRMVHGSVGGPYRSRGRGGRASGVFRLARAF